VISVSEGEHCKDYCLLRCETM